MPRYGEPVASVAKSPVVTEDGRMVSEDGMAELRSSLQNFPYAAYGIRVAQ